MSPKKGGSGMLRERILNKLKHMEGLDQRTLSQIAQVSEPAMSRYLNGFEEIKFESALRLVKYLYPEQEREVMSEYIPTQKSMNARHALEYCAMNGLWDLVEQTIKLLSSSNNTVDKEWAAMYQFFLMNTKRLLSPLEQLHQIEIFKPREKEIQILKSILKAYIYHELTEYRSVVLHVKDIDLQLLEIKTEFIKISFTVRINLIMSVIYKRANNLVQSRKYCHFILEQNYFDIVKAKAHQQIGLSYLYEDYQKSLYHLKEELKLNTYYGKVDFINKNLRNISFLKSFWGIDHTYSLPLDNLGYFLNYVYYLIKKDDLLLARKKINQIDINQLSERDIAFYYYYQGLITNEISHHLLSIKTFLNLNEHYHLQLPLKEIQKLQGNDAILNLLQ